ncbi:hypothetical protein BWQ96_04610 [Gracilariopsis chorda]|uniref:Uncharacterized protein n=1 Tax=Gracilariopsis chorda TaxID=448386 RepID=A0A2V3IU23_9FLOR|nr:hypothetical protein BWQ96_04610 [Gracilariopsis chorda]|eukprot:PXF45605.1 hypothetical protein BWQ96_04610 [Gracilariopsis chorda]
MGGGDKAKAAVLGAQRKLEEKLAKRKRPVTPDSSDEEHVYEAAPKAGASASAAAGADKQKKKHSDKVKDANTLKTDNGNSENEPHVQPKSPKLPAEQVAKELFNN